VNALPPDISVPWEALLAAARGDRHGSAGVMRDLATVAGRPRLGWVEVPPWPQVARVLRAHLRQIRGGRLVILGTGGWAFGARAAIEATGPQAGLRVLDVLDPAAVAEVLDGPPPPVLAVSESGRTLETRMLAGSLLAGGLSPRWLSGDELWLDPEAPSVALFGAPLSIPFLLAAIAAGVDKPGRAGRREVARVGQAYRVFARSAGRIGWWAGKEAARVPPGRGRITFALPAESGPGLRLFVLQALRQGLGSVEFVRSPSVEFVEFPTWSASADPLVQVMAQCYAVSAFVACVGLQRGIRFAEHPAVDEYKRLIASATGEPTPVPPDLIVPRAAAWLAAAGLDRGHLVCYDPRLTAGLAGVADSLESQSGRPWEVHPGSTWNHHSYQAVYSESDVGVVAVAPAADDDPLVRAQADIAGATCASLGNRALLLQPIGGTP
jgi:hypothetical protein